jgi:hypothetical protein
MSLVTQISTAFTAVATDVKRLRTYVTGTSTGDLTGLTTVTKTSIIAAINELVTRTVSNAASTALQTFTNGDTYMAGSAVTVDPAKLRAGSFYRCKFNVVKTAAGIAAPAISVRLGTLGTTGDTAQTSLTFAAQTGVIDEGVVEVLVNFRSVGAATSAVVQAEGSLLHRLVTTGLNVTGVFTSVLGTSGGFASTTVTKMGLSLNVGASSSWAVNVVQADLVY